MSESSSSSDTSEDDDDVPILSKSPKIVATQDRPKRVAAKVAAKAIRKEAFEAVAAQGEPKQKKMKTLTIKVNEKNEKSKKKGKNETKPMNMDS
jgi:hypothetical protein